MDYLERTLYSTWNKLPKKFKDRINNLELATKHQHKDYPKRLIEVTKGDDEYYRVMLYMKPLKNKLQEDIDKLIIRELARVFGFDEDEAYELMSKK